MPTVGDRLYRFMPGNIGVAPYFFLRRDVRADACTKDCKIAYWRSVYIHPRKFDYVPGEEECAPFTTGLGVVLAFKEIALQIVKEFSGASLSEIAPHGRASAKTRAEFEKYYEIIPDVRVPMTALRVPFAETIHCPKCNQTIVRASGVAEPRRQVKIGDRWEWVDPTDRNPEAGIFVPIGIMGSSEFISSYVFLCTERVKAYIEDMNLTYVEFREYGEVCE